LIVGTHPLILMSPGHVRLGPTNAV
jgi:hypothetical protein